MKKYFIMVLFFVGVIPTLYSQTYPQVFPCSAPYPTCISNSDFDAVATSYIMNFNGTNSVVNDWWVSHGLPEIFNFNAPNSPHRSINMKSHQPPGQSVQSQGIFTCYDFEQGETYQVCFWVKNTTWLSYGELRVYAANGMSQPAFPPATTIPNYPSSQVIDNSYSYNPLPNWTYVSVSFTPNQDYSQLWFYPYMAHDKELGREYAVVIDRVKVNKTSKTAGYNPTLTGTTNLIDGCGSSNLTINNLPQYAHTYWVPAPGLNVTSATTAIATPCVTTEYMALVEGDSTCPDCFRDTLRYLVNVNYGISQSDLINNNPTVICGNDIRLDFIGAPACPTATYEWYDPQGTLVGIGPNFLMTGATYAQSGLWELHVIFPNGCVEILTTQVNVVNCCSLTADFTFNASNPVTFTDATTGSGTIQSWHWDFGDGNTSTLPNPMHVYAAPGTYYVCLSIVMSDGTETCCDRECKQVTVGPNTGGCFVNPDFTFFAPIGTAQDIQFNSISTGNGTICWYEWDFGDGTSTTVNTNPSPKHFYANGNTTYTVCLRVWNCVYDANGTLIDICDDIICKQVYVPYFSEKTGPITSVEDVGKKTYKVNVYPNPATSEVFIDIEGIDNPKVSIVTIQSVKVGDAKKVSDLKYTLDVSGLAAGIYFVNVEGDNRKQVIKFFKE